MRAYKVTGPRPVLGADPGDVLKAAVTPEVEAAWLSAKRVEIVPCEYLVVGPHAVHGVEPGGRLKVALPLGREAALIDGGHLELVERKPEQSAEKRRGAPTPSKQPAIPDGDTKKEQK